MKCAQIEEKELVERYLTGSLGAEERDSFEEHYFACDRCFAALQTQRALQAELSASAPQICATPLPHPARLRWEFAIAAAAVLILTFFTLRWATKRNPSPAAQPLEIAKSTAAGPSLSDLAHFDPPAYAPAILRGSQSQSMREFRTAMRPYQQGEYARAVTALEADVKSNPRDSGALFFLGVSHLLAGQTANGIAVLQQCIALGDTPYLEEAHFYLAEGFLRKGDASAARSELSEVVRLKGDYEDKARRLLEQLPPPGKYSP